LESDPSVLQHYQHYLLRTQQPAQDHFPGKVWLAQLSPAQRATQRLGLARPSLAQQAAQALPFLAQRAAQ